MLEKEISRGNVALRVKNNNDIESRRPEASIDPRYSRCPVPASWGVEAEVSLTDLAVGVVALSC
jgi:hypothetical protein